MIEYQDCPSCGAERIRTTVRVCSMCEAYEKSAAGQASLLEENHDLRAKLAAVEAELKAEHAEYMAERKVRKKAERERDEYRERLANTARACEKAEARAEAAEKRLAQLEAYSEGEGSFPVVVVKPKSGRVLSFQTKTPQAAASAVAVIEAERDDALAKLEATEKELDELALAVGYGDRPEGHGYVIRMSGAELAEQWKSERAKLEAAEDERGRLRVLLVKQGAKTQEMRAKLEAAERVCSRLSETNVSLYRDLAASQAREERLLGLLRNLEWSGRQSYNNCNLPACPACHNYKDDDLSVLASARGGHRPDCALSAALSDTAESDKGKS